MVGVECTGEEYKCPECNNEFDFSENNFKGQFAWFSGHCKTHGWFIAYQENRSAVKGCCRKNTNRVGTQKGEELGGMKCEQCPICKVHWTYNKDLDFWFIPEMDKWICDDCWIGEEYSIAY